MRRLDAARKLTRVSGAALMISLLAVAAAHAARASVYPVAIAGPDFTPGPLRQLAPETGGTYHQVSSSSKLASIYDSIGRELARTWELRYPTTGRPGEALQRFASDRLKFEPGTEYRRSSYGWILVSAAVEAAAKRPFFTFMRTQIFEPLGMEDTRPDSSKESPTDRVTFYHPRFAGDTRYGPELVREGDYSCLAGGSGFLSTPSDLVRFGMAISGGKLLQPATVEILQSPQRLTSGQPTDYGLGWTLATVPLAGKRTRMAGHDTRRDFLGGTASLMLFPERQIVVAVTSNIGFADTRSAALKIAQAFAEERESAASK